MQQKMDGQDFDRLRLTVNKLQASVERVGGGGALVAHAAAVAPVRLGVLFGLIGRPWLNGQVVQVLDTLADNRLAVRLRDGGPSFSVQCANVLPEDLAQYGMEYTGDSSSSFPELVGSLGRGVPASSPPRRRG